MDLGSLGLVLSQDNEDQVKQVLQKSHSVVVNNLLKELPSATIPSVS